MVTLLWTSWDVFGFFTACPATYRMGVLLRQSSRYFWHFIDSVPTYLCPIFPHLVWIGPRVPKAKNGEYGASEKHAASTSTRNSPISKDEIVSLVRFSLSHFPFHAISWLHHISLWSHLPQFWLPFNFNHFYYHPFFSSSVHLIHFPHTPKPPTCVSPCSSFFLSLLFWLFSFFPLFLSSFLSYFTKRSSPPPSLLLPHRGPVGQ